MKEKGIRYSQWWFLFFASSVLVLIVIAFFSFRSLLYKVSQRQLTTYNMEIVEGCAQREATISTAIKDVFDSISFDLTLSKLMNYESVQASDMLHGLRQLAMYRKTTYYIDSIYIYNYLNKTIYVSSPNASEAVYSVDDFYDQGAIELIREYRDYQNMMPIYRTTSVSYPTVQNVDYVTYLRYNTLANNGETSILVINIRKDVLFSQLNAGILDTGTLLFFVDQGGVISSLDGLEQDDTAIDPIIDKVTSETNTSGFFPYTTESGTCTVCYCYVDDLGSVFISVSDNQSLSVGADEYIPSVALLVLLFTACCIACFIIIQRIRRILLANKDQIERMEEDRRRKAFDNRQYSLRAFMHAVGGEEQVPPLDKKELLQEGPIISRVVVLYLDSYSTVIPQKYETSRDRAMLKYGICNIAEEMLEKYGLLFASFEEDARCFAVLQATSDIADLTTQLSDFQKAVEEGLGISLSIFISASVPLCQIPSAYEALCDLLPYRQLLGPGSLSTSDMLEERELYSCTLSDDRLKRLSQEVLRLDIPRARLSLQEDLDEISKGSYKSFQVNLMQIIICLDDALSKLQINNGIDRDVYVDKQIYTVSSLDSIDAILDTICDILQQAEKLVFQNQNGHQLEMKDTIRQIVQENYSNRDFSINIVADKLGLSAAYLGRLFKKNMGMTFIEYVLSIRMNEARKLLAETDLPINELVYAVGFNDVPYFYKVFKKVNGCTPAVYRKSHQESDSK